MTTLRTAEDDTTCTACAGAGVGIGRMVLADHAERPQILSPEDADRVVRPLVADRDREHALLLSLDVRNRLIAVDLISVGTACNTFMAPREVYRDALIRGASSVFVAHNHPSGDPTPSPSDRSISRRLKRAGATLGVEMLDHLVIGDSGFVSLARRGDM